MTRGIQAILLLLDCQILEDPDTVLAVAQSF